jgi:hypothetical protein
LAIEPDAIVSVMAAYAIRADIEISRRARRSGERVSTRTDAAAREEVVRDDVGLGLGHRGDFLGGSRREGGEADEDGGGLHGV